MLVSKVSIENGQVTAPDQPTIPFIEGDGIGPDLWRAAVRVFDGAIEQAYGGKRKIIWKEILAGQKAFDQTGNWLPDESLEAMRDYLVSIKGPLTTPVGGGIRSLNVAIRQTLDLYACVRPIEWFQGVPSPVKHPENVNMVLFRENTEDIYAGIEFMAGSAEAKRLQEFLVDELEVQYDFHNNPSLGIKPVSKSGSQRLIRSAIDYALANKRPSVTLVHKGNIMKFTEGAFKNWGYELADAEYGERVYSWPHWEKTKAQQGEDAANAELQQAKDDGKIIITDVIADNFLQQILLNPQAYSVVATLNLNGDYLSDALAAMVGGIGISPGANINYRTGHAVFEATHGTAPRFANTNTMNPSSLILSGVMMLEYMGWQEAADKIKWSLATTILNKTVTVDFYNLMEGATLLKTDEFADKILENIS